MQGISDNVSEANEFIGEYVITDTISHVDEVIVYLIIDGEVIETTPEHPFYTADGQWIAAGDLDVGTLIRNLDGDYGTVESVVFITQSQPMYNLTVAEAHTFFVGDGQWLVHNITCPPGWTRGRPEPGHKRGAYKFEDTNK